MADRYVRADGSDSNDGSADDAAHAWLTHAHAVSAATTGDTIHTAAGTYSAFSITKALDFIGATGAIISGGTYGITVSHDDVSLTGYEVSGWADNGVRCYGYDNCVVDGLEIHSGTGAADGSRAALYFRDCSGGIVRNTHFHDCYPTLVRMIDCSTMLAENNDLEGLGNGGDNYGEDGFSVYGVDITIQDNHIHHTNSQYNHGDGIVVQAPWGATYGDDTTGVVIQRNLVEDCSQYIYIDSWGQVGYNIDGVRVLNNILICATTSQYQTGICLDAERGTISNVDVINNTCVNFDNAGSGGSAAFRFVTRSAAYDHVKVRNLLTSNSRIEIESGPTITNLTFDHADLYNSGGVLCTYHGTQYSSLAALQAASGLFSDSVNVDPDLNASYAPNAGSGIIGAGVGPSADADVPTDDYDGDARSGSTTDIGAQMYVSEEASAASGDAQSPSSADGEGSEVASGAGAPVSDSEASGGGSEVGVGAGSADSGTLAEGAADDPEWVWFADTTDSSALDTGGVAETVYQYRELIVDALGNVLLTRYSNEVEFPSLVKDAAGSAASGSDAEAVIAEAESIAAEAASAGEASGAAAEVGPAEAVAESGSGASGAATAQGAVEDVSGSADSGSGADGSAHDVETASGEAESGDEAAFTTPELYQRPLSGTIGVSRPGGGTITVRRPLGRL